MAGFIRTLDQKYQELSVLSSFLDDPSFTWENTGNFLSFLEVKRELMRRLRAQSFLKNSYPNTNFGPQLISWYGWQIQQKYSRQGDLVYGEDQARLFYPGAPEDLPAQSFFFSSGQAATHVIAESLVKYLRLRPVLSGTRPYFESSSLLSSLELADARGKFIFVDSSAADFTWKEALESVQESVLVFDSTCVERTSPEFISFLAKVQAKRAPVIIVRSHLKLDSLGVEYGNLGSAVILNPLQFPGGEGFVMEVKRIGGLLAHFTTVDAIYPFLLSREASDLNQKRLARVRANNQMLADFLTSEGHACERRPHGYFLELRREGFPHKLLPAAINKIRLVSGFPVFYSDSFGLDFSNFNLYHDYYGGPDSYTLRVGAPDLLKEEFSPELKIYLPLVENFFS